MWRRMGIMGTALAVVALGGITAPTEAAAAGKTWCMTYCDAIHLGCRKTVGWLDEDACEEWKKGCLDGCKVND